MSIKKRPYNFKKRKTITFEYNKEFYIAEIIKREKKPTVYGSWRKPINL